MQEEIIQKCAKSVGWVNVSLLANLLLRPVTFASFFLSVFFLVRGGGGGWGGGRRNNRSLSQVLIFFLKKTVNLITSLWPNSALFSGVV